MSQSEELNLRVHAEYEYMYGANGLGGKPWKLFFRLFIVRFRCGLKCPLVSFNVFKCFCFVLSFSVVSMSFSVDAVSFSVILVSYGNLWCHFTALWCCFGVFWCSHIAT